MVVAPGMADEVAANAPVPTPAVVPPNDAGITTPPAASVETQAASSTVPPSGDAVISPTADAPAPAVEPAKTDAPAPDAAAAPESPPSLLDKAAEKPAPTEPPKDGKDAPVDAKAPVPEPTAVTYQPLTLPEGVTLDQERLGQFDTLLGKHQVSPELRQELANMHVAETQAIADRLSQAQRDTYTRFREQKVAQFEADPELGGNRRDTSLASAISVVDRWGGTPEQRRELLNDLKLTGMGDFPSLIRLLNNVDRAMERFTDEGGAVPANPAKGETRTRAQRRYGSNGAAAS